MREIKKKKLNLETTEIIERLGSKFSSPEYGFITQVRNGTGYMANRTADAMAMSLWPSRGLHIYGFEVKASRTDWLKELKSPDKADAMAIYCHYWYVVVGSADIIREEELPKTWGLMIPYGKGLKIQKEAVFNKKALQFDELMLAGIFRNVSEHCIPKELVDIKIAGEVKIKVEGWKESREESRKEVSELKDIIRDFETKTGLCMSSWDKESNKELIKAIKMALEGNKKIAEIRKELEKLKGLGDRIGKYVEGELKSYQL